MDQNDLLFAHNDDGTEDKKESALLGWTILIVDDHPLFREGQVSPQHAKEEGICIPAGGLE